MITVSHLSVKFGTFYAVKDISFSVESGEIFGFLGANGAGKTTTIRVLCGLLPPSSGTISVEGIGFEDGLEHIKARVGYMSQRFTLYEDLSVEENLEFTASLRKLPRQDYLNRRREILDFIGFARPLDTMVRDLPGGIKQQVSLAAAVLHRPQVVFLDEPTAGVTPVARARFWALIRQLSDAGQTVFVTTHYMDEAEQCGRIALMRAGEIIALDTPKILKQNTFPHGVFELSPKKPPTSEIIARIKRETNGFSIQPHGRLFHALVHDMLAWENAQTWLAGEFTVTAIAPSLEDVFLQLVEGRSQ
ncbi:MAG: ABC transporter ATP-binding protein [Acidiferrobacterales bacterium]